MTIPPDQEVHAGYRSKARPTDPLTEGEPNVVAKERTVSRRRRPSGEPPPIPRSIQISGKVLLAEAALVFLVLLLVALVSGLGAQLDRMDTALLRWIAQWRTSTFTSAARATDAVLSSPITLGLLRWGALLGLIALRRFRHFFVFVGAILAVGLLTTAVSLVFVRARPVGVDIIGHWQGASLPSRPVAILAVTLMGIAYSFAIPGSTRNFTKRATQVLVLALGLSRVYLGVDHLTDVVIAGVLGFSIPVIAFRSFVPNEVFPITYRRGRTAHLDVGGDRGEAIRRAINDQLGIRIRSMKPFGLAGSGGSTPLLVHTAQGSQLFAKLYAANHLRADRWYKLGRALLYGRLEDEAAFNTVRRLVQYEDYMLLAMWKSGLPVPEPYGIVEITPEREYLLVAEFLDGSTEILEADLTEEVIDGALEVVRKLWDAGLAHRDIKPSNILVRGGEVYLIDVAFGEIRPSPWRQAVDLANMMLVLALLSDPEHVYRRACRFFTPEEIAEAFGATRSVTMPNQSRRMLRKDRRDLIARFRELAPQAPRIPIQHWSWRRVMLTASVLLAAFIAVQALQINLRGGGWLAGPSGAGASYAVVTRPPACGFQDGEQLVLEVQSVPSARFVPCLHALPSGWDFHSLLVQDRSSRITLTSGSTDATTAKVILTRRCEPGRDVTQRPPQDGMRRYEMADVRLGRYTQTHYYVFDGGCIRYQFDLPADADQGASVLASQVVLALDFEKRDDIANRYFKATGLHLLDVD